jgi:glycosyltransferase involved in cell wall biosynthesis
MLPSVAIISFSPIYSDSRVLRQIQALGSLYQVYSIGYGPRPCCTASHLRIPSNHNWWSKLCGLSLLLSRRFDLFYDFWFMARSINTFVAAHNIQAVILNDVTAWPLLRHLPKDISILDAHEFSPLELSDQLVWRLSLAPFKIWCSRFASNGSWHFCVEPNLCILWERFTGCRFYLLPNSAPYSSHRVPRLKDPGVVRVLHHGVAHPSRRLELMLEAITTLGPAYSGTFLLTGSDSRYLSRLRKLATASNCVILPPVPPDELISEGYNYDLAILSIYPSNINYEYCLPNKLYQFIQSRLPIVCGPTPSIAAIVRQYDIGVVADDFTAPALARALKSMTPQRLGQMRLNLDRAARELCWERDQHILLDAVQAMVNRGS